MQKSLVGLLMISAPLYALNVNSQDDGSVLIKGLNKATAEIYIIDSKDDKKVTLEKAKALQITKEGDNLRLKDTSQRQRELLITYTKNNNRQVFRLSLPNKKTKIGTGNTASIIQSGTQNQSSISQNFLKNEDFHRPPSPFSKNKNTVDVRHNFTNKTIKDKNFSHQSLNKASFVNATIEGGSFAGSHFSKASLVNTVFNHVDMIQANFSLAELINVDFSHVDLKKANFNGATLINVSFDNSDLSGAIWTDGSICKNQSINHCIK